MVKSAHTALHELAKTGVLAASMPKAPAFREIAITAASIGLSATIAARKERGATARVPHDPASGFGLRGPREGALTHALMEIVMEEAKNFLATFPFPVGHDCLGCRKRSERRRRAQLQFFPRGSGEMEVVFAAHRKENESPACQFAAKTMMLRALSGRKMDIGDWYSSVILKDAILDLYECERAGGGYGMKFFCSENCKEKASQNHPLVCSARERKMDAKEERKSARREAHGHDHSHSHDHEHSSCGHPHDHSHSHDHSHLRTIIRTIILLVSRKKRSRRARFVGSPVRQRSRWTSVVGAKKSVTVKSGARNRIGRRGIRASVKLPNEGEPGGQIVRLRRKEERRGKRSRDCNSKTFDTRHSIQKTNKRIPIKN